jgi:hypothetical protein
MQQVLLLLLLLLLCCVMGWQQLLVSMALALVAEMWLHLACVIVAVNYWAAEHTAGVACLGWLVLCGGVACCCCRCPWHFVFVAWCCYDACCIALSSLKGH